MIGRQQGTFQALVYQAQTALFVGVAGLLGACQSSPRPERVDDPRAATQVAEAATRTGNWSVAADRWYAVFMSDGKQPIEPCVHAARAMLELKDFKGANHVIDLGLQRHPKNAELLELKSAALIGLGFRRPAEDYLVRVLAIEPKRVSALLALAQLRIDLGLESSAIEPLQRALALTGGDFKTYSLLARATRAAGHTCAAYEAYVNAFALGEGEVDDLIAASTLSMDPLVCKAHAEARASALHWLERAIARDPQSTPAHFQLGVLYEELGSTDEAIAHYRRAVETDPSCLESLTNLAVLYASLGDEQNTRDMVQRALVFEHNDDRRKALEHLVEQFELKQLSASKHVETP